MILKYINLVFLACIVTTISACSSSSGSTTAGLQVTLSATAKPANVADMPAGAKTFNNDLGDSITITKAYLVISSATIETSCGASFSAAIDGVLDVLIPQAQAHTTTTPTSTGDPYVINLLNVDGGAGSIGSVSPPTGDYCGVDIDLLAADADANNLPTAAGEPDMVGKTIYIEGTYTLSGGGATGAILMKTGAALSNRKVLLSALMMLSNNNLNGSINLGINYDTWFDSVNLVDLEADTAPVTDLAKTSVIQVLQNISSSIHQL